MIDLFKDYAAEEKGGAILGDSIMVIIAVILASLFANLSTNSNIILAIILLYKLPYILHTF